MTSTNILGLGALLLLAIITCQPKCPAVRPSGNVGPPQCDRLSPVRSVLTSQDYGAARNDAAVSQTLFSRVPLRNSINLDTGEELVVSLVKRDPNANAEAVYVLSSPPRASPPEYKVVHARAKAYLLSDGASTDAEFWEAPIDEEVVRSLERSWGTMARGARWPSREEMRRMHWGGATYTFEYRGDNVDGQGYVVSPHPATCTSELVTIGELLVRYADEPDPNRRQPVRAELLRRSKALAARLQASGEPLAGEPLADEPLAGEP